MSGTARELTAHAARTPASIMLVERRRFLLNARERRIGVGVVGVIAGKAGDAGRQVGGLDRPACDEHAVPGVVEGSGDALAGSTTGAGDQCDRHGVRGPERAALHWV
jgi:hypothetical protein